MTVKIALEVASLIVMLSMFAIVIGSMIAAILYQQYVPALLLALLLGLMFGSLRTGRTTGGDPT